MKQTADIIQFPYKVYAVTLLFDDDSIFMTTIRAADEDNLREIIQREHEGVVTAQASLLL